MVEKHSVQQMLVKTMTMDEKMVVKWMKKMQPMGLVMLVKWMRELLE
jgi:hypothetical protein